MKYTFFLLIIAFSFIHSQTYKSPIDTVLWFIPGKGQSLGQDSAYFPMNIFSLPDTNASSSIPSSSPKDICSLGLGGEIVVGFKNYYLVDGDGPDFTIFENAFVNPVNKKVFAEPAVVSVSEDGINFYEFPWDYYSLEGCAGTVPTNGKADPFDPNVSGGNSFDLAKVGISRARWIKIKDICDTILKNPNHPYYDPLLSGFDLDCVVGLNLEMIPLRTEQTNTQSFHFRIENENLFLFMDKANQVEVFDLVGRKIWQVAFESEVERIDFSCFDGNVFFVYIANDYRLVVLNVIKIGDEIIVK
ncbi:MAG: hypothetical protein ACPLPX_03490 [Candidatus Kapaibacteriota bacterium]